MDLSTITACSSGGGGGDGAWTTGQINDLIDASEATQAATETLLGVDVDPIIVEDGTGGAATATFYGWNLFNDTEDPASINIEFESGTFQTIVVYLAAGESVTFTFDVPITATTVQFDSTGVTGTLFVDLA